MEMRPQISKSGGLSIFSYFEGFFHKAQHDWKGSHRQWERAQGLVDLSDSIFEGDMAPEHDVGIVAQFLNSSLLAAFGKKAARYRGDIGKM